MALAAAQEALARMAAANQERTGRSEEPLGFGLGLHIGNVMFGNVGLADRLAFSVFGSAVNEATRLEQLTKKFQTPIVASGAFKDYCGGEWDTLGQEKLRGSESPMPLFRPTEKGERKKPVAIARRDRSRQLSDAEAVVLLHRDSAA
jgi:adenylate cyclase